MRILAVCQPELEGPVAIKVGATVIGHSLGTRAGHPVNEVEVQIMRMAFVRILRAVTFDGPHCSIPAFELDQSEHRAFQIFVAQAAATRSLARQTGLIGR